MGSGQLQSFSLETGRYSATIPVELIYAIDSNEGTGGDTEEEKKWIEDAVVYATQLNSRVAQDGEEDYELGDSFEMEFIFDRYKFTSSFYGPHIYQPGVTAPKLLVAVVSKKHSKDVIVVYDSSIVVFTLPWLRSDGSAIRIAMARTQLPNQSCSISKSYWS